MFKVIHKNGSITNLGHLLNYLNHPNFSSMQPYGLDLGRTTNNRWFNRDEWALGRKLEILGYAKFKRTGPRGGHRLHITPRGKARAIALYLEHKVALV